MIKRYLLNHYQLFVYIYSSETTAKSDNLVKILPPRSLLAAGNLPYKCLWIPEALSLGGCISPYIIHVCSSLSLSLSTCASPLVLCLLFAKKPHRKPSCSYHERVIKICCIHFTPGDNVHLLAKIEKRCMKACLYSGTRWLFVWCRHLLHLASVVDSLLVIMVALL